MAKIEMNDSFRSALYLLVIIVLLGIIAFFVFSGKILTNNVIRVVNGDSSEIIVLEDVDVDYQETPQCKAIISGFVVNRGDIGREISVDCRESLYPIKLETNNEVYSINLGLIAKYEKKPFNLNIELTCGTKPDYECLIVKGR